ncbi:MAG: asparagine synthase (glutamine-hydrolyzing) [Deltaproteobacteria bacterium]
MCGFVALFLPGRRPVDPRVLDGMTDAMRHRGPDGRGVHAGPGFGLGHRRLAIIDLDGGAQPLLGADDRVAVTFNGEIYNYRALRDGLDGPWRTHSDTEVFLRTYETHGVAGLDRLVGMWGAAIWDGRHERLVVSRDRLGIKPVYYVALQGGGFAFASEIRALLAHPDVHAELDPSALDELLTYRYVPAPHTIFAGIKKLLPGHYAIADANGLKITRYWNVLPAPRPLSDDEAEERFLEAFDQSVASRMVADVPVGIFLSGGIDSSAVLEAMHRRDVAAFTIGFEDNEKDDEIVYAKETAAMYGAQHYALTIGPSDYAAYFDRYAEALEEPVLNDSAMATNFLSGLARQHVKVVLSGQGADEPLAGYDRFKGELLSPLFARVPGVGHAAPLVERSSASEKVKRAFRSLTEPDDVARALRIYAVFQEEEKDGLLRSARAPDVASPIRRWHADVGHLSPLGRMLYTDTRMWLVDDLLMVADKLSMAHGLELRVPFLDHRLVELLETMPDDQKIRVTRRGIETKRVHRRAMARRLPDAILNRKKRGFTNPMDRWLRTALAGLVEERLLGGDTRLANWLDPAGIERIWAAHRAGQDRRRQLFLLLTLDAWARRYLD